MKRIIAVFMIAMLTAVTLAEAGFPASKAMASGGIKTGIVKKGSGYYLYNSKGKIIKKTKTIKGVKYYIGAGKKHKIRARVYRGKYYYANGRRMTSADKHDFKTLLRAEKIVKRITKKKWSRMRKLKKCFRWVMKFPYVTRRRFSRFKKDWPALYADDHFIRKGGECHADGAAFAYLAAACGYKKAYVCLDSRVNGPTSHGFAEVNGRAFDPLFAQAKSFSNNWNARYGVYNLRPAAKIRIPYGKASHNKKGKMIPVKTTGMEKPKNKGKKKILKWSSSKKKLYYNDGTVVKGTVVWKGKFYAFTSKGVYREAFTKKLRAAAKQGRPISELVALIGQPKSKDYQKSCNGDGDDGVWKYSGFTVTTFRPKKGTEIFWFVE